MQKRCIQNIETFMSQYSVDRSSYKTGRLYLIIGSMLIISYDTYWFGTSGVKIFEFLRNIFIVGLPFCLYVSHPRTPISKSNSFFLFYLVSVVTLSSIFNGNTISAPLLIFSGIFIAFYLMTKYSFYDIAKCFSNIIIVISIYSLIVYFAAILKIIPLNSVENKADTIVLTAFSCQFFPELGDMIIRNSSIFREPGVYMIILNFAIIFELFVVKDKQCWCKVTILIISLITLLSTGGFICLSLIFLIYFFNSTKGVINIILISGIIVTLLFPLIDEDIINLVFSNKFDEMETSGSGFARMSSFFIPLDIFLKYPLIGCGFDQFKLEYIQVGQELYHRYVDPQGLSTNTLMNVFAVWGFFMGVFYIYGFYKLSRLISKGRNIISAILMLVCIFLMFSNENMPYWPFIYIFMFYGISAKNYHQIPLALYGKERINTIARIQGW